MHKKYRIYLGLILGMIAIILLSASAKDRGITCAAADWTPLEQVFMATGAKLRNASISGWVRVNAEHYDLGQLKELAIHAARELSNPGSAVTCTTFTEAGHTTFRAVTRNKEQDVTATVQVMELQGGKPEIYLVVDIDKKDGTTEIGDIEQRVLGIICKNGKQYAITTCLSGWVNGKLEEEKMTQLAKQAFRSVNGRIIEGVNSPQFVSYAGITEAIDRSITVGKNCINLNVAMRHNNIEQRTYVTAATPIITHEY